MAIRCLESSVLGSSRSQPPGRIRKLRNMQNLSNVAHAPPEAHRKFLIYCNEGQYVWSVRQLSLWRPTANSSLPFSENVCLLKPKMKWQKHQHSRLVMRAFHLQVCIPEERTLSKQPRGRDLGNLPYWTGCLDSLPPPRSTPRLAGFWLHKHSYLCCPDKKQTLGESGFTTTQEGKGAVPENCRLGKGFPPKPYN